MKKKMKISQKVEFKKEVNKYKNEDSFYEKNYVNLFDYLQYLVLQVVISVIIIPVIFGSLDVLEFFFNGSAINSILFLVPYLYIIDFIIPKASIPKRIYGFKIFCPKDVKLKEKLIFICLKLIDILIAPIFLFICVFFPKVRMSFFSEKFTRIFMYKTNPK